MKPSQTQSRCRSILTTLIWSLPLLLVTNAYWSWRFSQYFPTSYEEQWWEFLITYPSDPFGYLAADDQYSVTYIVPWKTKVDYPWLSRFDTVTGPERTTPEQRELWPQFFEPQPDAAPSWVKPERLRNAHRLAAGEFEVEMFTATGWPVRLLWCRWKRDQSGQAADRSTAIVLNEPGGQEVASAASVLPFRPVWTGQLIYGSFWFAVVALLRTSWWVLRRGWRDQRARRGRCTFCNYDLRGNTTGVCPECGAAITPRETP
ncbi:MAG: hypothetical protein IT430_03585 [Phycisphaerales bacterium]|nr:hypothetical protein [Phycisphaerales bacterium]